MERQQFNSFDHGIVLMVEQHENSISSHCLIFNRCRLRLKLQSMAPNV